MLAARHGHGMLCVNRPLGSQQGPGSMKLVSRSGLLATAIKLTAEDNFCTTVIVVFRMYSGPDLTINLLLHQR
jgi:hypothetical protein